MSQACEQTCVGIANDQGDFYAFTPFSTGLSSINLSGFSQNLDLALYNGTGASLGQVQRASSNTETIAFNLTGGTRYLIGVTPNGTVSSNYSLSIDTPDAQSDMIDGTAVTGGDAGNTTATATSATLNVSGRAAITGTTGFPGDSSDHYQFIVHQTGQATITLGSLSANLDLTLRDSSGNTLVQSRNSGTIVETITRSLDAGTSSVEVSSVGSEAASYSLNIAAFVDLSDRVGTTVVTGGDAGGAQADAVSLSLDANGDATLSGAVVPASDSSDYYRFTAQISGALSLAVSGLTSNAQISLLDNTGRVLVSDTGTGTADETLRATLVGGQDYFVRVQQAGPAGTLYNIALDGVTPVDVINGMAVPGNDASNLLASPNLVALDQSGDGSVTGYIGVAQDGADIYSFTTRGLGTGTITLGNLTNNIDISLFDSNGRILATSQSGGASNEVITTNLLGNTTYTLQITPAGAVQSGYSLSINTATASNAQPDMIGPNIVGTGDAGNTTSSAALFRLDDDGDQAITGSIGFSGDTFDFY
ncbi:MAG: pre-peptidase C-terminal domain-containing protein, partial [Pseudomonadota bacterium]